jgi:hypothetical protein
MSTTPPSDPWGMPPDRPDQPEPDQPIPNQPRPDQPVPDQPVPDQPIPDQPMPDQPMPDQPAAPGGPPTVDEPTADPWAAPPSEPTAGSAFDGPAGEFTQQPPVYPPAPTPPEMPYAGQRPKPNPPSSILTAVKLMYVGAALSAISFLTSLLTQDSVREQALEGDPTLTESELDAIVTVGIFIGVFVGLIGILLWVWMAETNRRGKSWARIVATVLGALNIVFTLVGLFIGQNSGLVVVFSVISAALAAVILYLLYRPDSNAYYEAVSDLRR